MFRLKIYDSKVRRDKLSEKKSKSRKSTRAYLEGLITREIKRKYQLHTYVYKSTVSSDVYHQTASHTSNVGSGTAIRGCMCERGYAKLNSTEKHWRIFCYCKKQPPKLSQEHKRNTVAHSHRTFNNFFLFCSSKLLSINQFI